MTAPSKPAVRPIWADTAGPPLDLVDPGDAFITAGWPSSGTPPSRGRFNFILKYVWDGIRYLCQHGLPEYDSAETYGHAATVLNGADGLIYFSLQDNNTNHAPGSSPTWWTSPAVPTRPPGDNNAYVSSTQFVAAAVAAEAAARIGADAATLSSAQVYTNGAVAAESSARAAGDAGVLATSHTYTDNSVAPKANSLSPNFTGIPTAPTQARGNSSGLLATTAFVVPGNFHSANGFELLPSGLILQWGIITVVNGTNNVVDVTITFPIAFTSQVFGVFPATFRSVTGNGQAINGSNFSSGAGLQQATITVDSSSSGSSTARWFALGI